MSPRALVSFVSLAWDLAAQRHQNQMHLEPVLRANGGEALDAAQWNKAVGYYGLAVPAVVGRSLAAFRGASYTREERRTLSFLGALSPLLDDCFDQGERSVEHLKALAFHPELQQPADPVEACYCALASKAESRLPTHRAVFENVRRAVYEAQLASMDQARGNSLSTSDLMQRSIEKGGRAFQLYALGLNGGDQDKMQQWAYALGAAFQLENDLFDIWKDRQEGIQTVFTEAKSIDELRDAYKQGLDLLGQATADFKGSRKSKIRALRPVALVLARGLVCLDFLERGSDTHGVFDAYAWEREALVCDMESWKGFWGTLRQFDVVYNSLIARA